MPMASELANPPGGSQQGLRCGLAEGYDHFGLNNAKLRFEVGPAGGYLVRSRRAVLRRATLDDVADEYLISRKAHRLDHFREQLACPANKRESLRILIGPRAFAHEDETSSRIPLSEDGLGSSPG